MAEHRGQFSIRAMCRCLRIQPSGFYAWLQAPVSARAQEDRRQTELLQEAWVESGKVYGYRKLHDDLVEQGESICPNRVARLTQLAGIKAQIGYKRRPGSYGGKPSVVVDNTLDRQFDVEAPDKVWVTDITYIRTQEGFAYLAVIIDLYSRRVVGWSMQSRQTTDVVLQALLMAVWRRKPKTKVLIHSDQGSQFTSMDWAAFLRAHNLEHAVQHDSLLRQFGGQRPVLRDPHGRQQQKQHPGPGKGQPCRAFQKRHRSRHDANLAGRKGKGNRLIVWQASSPRNA